MARVSKFTVVPKLPKRLEPLREIANNLWWSWDPEAIDLFYRIDPSLWMKSGQNPCGLLGSVSQVRLEELAETESYLAHLDRVHTRMTDYMNSDPWSKSHPRSPEGFQVAYFSAEFGIHESVKIYSGGLGVLAGDHLKAASDLGLPLIGIGLLYRGGYFRQYLNADGWQQEEYPRNDFYNLPFSRVRDKNDAPMIVEIQMPDGTVKVNVWKCQVGRVTLYLLDCDNEENTPEHRAITAQLYGGDHDTRVRQEIILGMGGVVALHRMGIHPTVYHMNEGHSAFMALQRIRDLVHQEGLSFQDAAEIVKAGSFFTTHTPVPAGNDIFDPGLVTHYFTQYCADVGIGIETLLDLGRQNPKDKNEAFCMTVLALKLSAGANGVSKLHGEVARNMWALTWKGVPEDEVPITSITNGVHTRSFVSRELMELYDRYLAPSWSTNPTDQTFWSRVDDIPDTELWRMHERRRERLVEFARMRLYKQYENRGATSEDLKACLEVLNPEALTIGFARRFATYKRATLILLDKARLKRLLLNRERPIQFIIAGKAHPADNAGKQLIKDLYQFGRDPDLRRSFIFIEDYDINVARYLVQGVDCWLNTPRRPMEASGTSGMKASANGAQNISISDGWWCEAENLGPNGWSIGRGENYEDTEEQDRVESDALYDILEKEVAPLFYNRGQDGLPREWLQRMKSAIGTIGPIFNTIRMVEEYADRFYIPCSERRLRLRASEFAGAKALAVWKKKVHDGWRTVKFVNVSTGETEGLPYGGSLVVTAEVELGKLSPDDVVIEIFYGELDPHGDVPTGRSIAMKLDKQLDGNRCRYAGNVTCDKTGQLGFKVRAIPSHPDLAERHETGWITWA